MDPFHEEFQEDIVEQNTNTHQHKIPDQLNPTPKDRAGEDDEFGQDEPGREANAEGHQECGYIRADGETHQMYHFLMQDKMITDEEQGNIHQCGKAATGQVTEGQVRNIPPERGIEKIDSVADQVLHPDKIGTKLRIYR